MINVALIIPVMISGLAGAAIPKGDVIVSYTDKQIVEALKLPIENRVQALKAQGSDSWRRLSELIFEEGQPLSVRWRGLTGLARVHAGLGRAAVERALAGSEWYMRNAAVVALPAFDREYALDRSQKLLSDPALVVRTAAVQNIMKLGGRQSESILWEKLNSEENFRNQESLWIRRHIARALSEFARPGQEEKFVKILNDRDERLHPFAIRALERIASRKSEIPTGTINERRQKWLAWWQEKSSSISR